MAMLGGLIDNIVIGQFLGMERLGAMGIVAPVMFLCAAIGSIGATGGNIMAANAFGRGALDEMRNVFSVTLMFDLIVGSVIMLCGLLLASPFAQAMQANAELLPYSEQYIRGFAIGVLPMILSSSMTPFVQMDGSKNLPLISSAVMLGSDIVLDLIVIKFFDGSMFAMALASSVSYFLSFFVICLHFRRKHRNLRIQKPVSFGKVFIRELGLSLPIVVNSSSDLIRTMILNHFLIVISITAVAAMNIRNQAQNLIGGLALGCAFAVTAVAGMLYGEQDGSALGKALKTALLHALVICGAAAVILAVIPDAFAALMGIKDPAAMQICTTALRCFAISLPLRAVGLVMGRYYQSTGHLPYSLFQSVLQSLVLPVVYSVILIKPFGTTGVWVSFPLAEATTLAVILIFIFVRGKKNVSFKERVMMLPDHFGGVKEDRLELAIGNDLKEADQVARQIYAFGEERGISQDVVNRLALCIEEMAVNIISHSFKPGEKKWFEVRISRKPEHIYVRIRDNGRYFSPLAYLEEHREDSPEKYPGLLIVKGMTETFTYRRGLNLNIVVFTIKE